MTDRRSVAEGHLREHGFLKCADDARRDDDEHLGFEKLQRSLAARRDDDDRSRDDYKVHDPAALAAWIGRRKMGKEAFQKKAVEGRHKAHHHDD